jgi:hypothetical protein
VIGLMVKMNHGAPLAISNGVKVAGAPALSVDDSLCEKLLPFVLSVAAGSVDIIGFLGLNGLFTAHVTGNVVVLAAKLVARDEAPLAFLISVPVFVAVLALTALLAAGLKHRQIPLCCLCSSFSSFCCQHFSLSPLHPVSALTQTPQG